jgi:hypothetical protein
MPRLAVAAKIVVGRRRSNAMWVTAASGRPVCAGVQVAPLSVLRVKPPW